MQLGKKEKIRTIEKLIVAYKKQCGIVISKPAEDYVNMIDYLIENDFARAIMPLAEIFKTVCRMEGDFAEE